MIADQHKHDLPADLRGHLPAAPSAEDLNDFLARLADLCLLTGIAISGGTLFYLEPDDRDLRYACDEDSNLHFD